MNRIGILPLGRPTFDVDYATAILSAMLSDLDRLNLEVVGPRELLIDEVSTREAIATLCSAGIDRLLLLQVTFTDAMLTVEAAAGIDVPLRIWAVPEPRTGGRLRLNAFCGLNLASHALRLFGHDFAWTYANPGCADLEGLLTARRPTGPLEGTVPNDDATRGHAMAASLKTRRIGRIGNHPDGFHTCAFEPRALSAFLGDAVDEIPLEVLFANARATTAESVSELRDTVARRLPELGTLDPVAVERSLQLKLALDRICRERQLHAVALRCWPETFTEYGGAVCGPASMLASAGIPCACEADVYGALTQLLLQEASNSPVFLTDLVDIDLEDNTGVVWHCGQAPMEMADPEFKPQATIHSNRKLPLLFEFPLRPGRVTMARISQARGSPKLVLASGAMVRRPIAFSGTSGVVRFDRPSDAVLRDVMASGLEHHLALAYGDHFPALRSFAAALGLPVIELGERREAE